MGIVIQLLSLREKKSARERERHINTKKKKRKKYNPIRSVVPKSSSLVRHSSEPPREKHTVEYLRGIFNKRRGKKGTVLGPVARGALRVLTVVFNHRETQTNVREGFCAATGDSVPKTEKRDLMSTS